MRNWPRDRWFKSSRSNGGCTCVETMFTLELVLIRDSKYSLDPDNDPKLQPILSVTHAQWSQFIEAIHNGITTTFDTALCATPTADGGMTLTTSDSDVVLTYNEAEVDAFIGGVRQHEFDLAATA